MAVNKLIKKTYQYTAFTLIELSLAILIIAILVVGTLTVSRSTISSAQLKETKEKLEIINQSLANFLAVNKRLPCPAPLNVAKGSSTYGEELLTSGVCTTADDSAVFDSTSATNLLYGALPAVTLNLDEDMVEDGFESKFSYIVDDRFTESYTSSGDDTGFEGTTADSIDIKELLSTQTAMVSDAVFVVISHGANKSGAYPANSTSRNSGSSNTEETDNQPPTSGTTNGFDDDFIINATSDDYDDLVLFKTKLQIAIDSGFEDMKCIADASLNYTPSCHVNGFSWNEDANYGEEKENSSGSNPVDCDNVGGTCTGTQIPSRFCGKYGRWSQVINDC